MGGYGAKWLKHPYPIMMNLVWTPVFDCRRRVRGRTKIKSLLQAGAHVTLVSTEFTEGSRSWRFTLMWY